MLYQAFSKEDEIFRIHIDMYPRSPRTEWDNYGVMICDYKDYSLGDQKHGYNLNHYTLNEILDEIKEELSDEGIDIVYLPLYVYEHGDITMNTTGYSCPFDSSCMGFIYAPLKMHKEIGEWSQEFRDKHYSGMSDTEIIVKLLKSEIEVYDQYLRNDVYTYEVVKVVTCNLGHEHENHIDSGGGYYGDDFKANGLYESVGISDITLWTEL